MRPRDPIDAPPHDDLPGLHRHSGRARSNLYDMKPGVDGWNIARPHPANRLHLLYPRHSLFGQFCINLLVISRSRNNRDILAPSCHLKRSSCGREHMSRPFWGASSLLELSDSGKLMVFSGAAMCIGGPAFVMYISPSEEEIFKVSDPSSASISRAPLYEILHILVSSNLLMPI